jgi:hypothetical protein
MFGGDLRGRGSLAKGRARWPSGAAVAGAVDENDHLNMCFVTTPTETIENSF